MLKLLYFISDSPEEAHLHQFNWESELTKKN
jgi:hypothetical protein